MSIEDWWPALNASTHQCLINNNRDVVLSNILDQITAVAGPARADASWVRADDGEGFLLSDDASDWIEKTANDEATEDN
ncbi:hypothetical protein AAGW05_17215 [Arthrobacter sp. LAPM80]|uniref:hypothetical protein n=1 Tax=Arthrobacter sp. LAPM80 TaxID=3141788 RepID=UPI00398B2396